MSEKDLAAKVVEYLEENGWDVYQEVPTYGGNADILAVKNGLLWAIECKTSLTFKVIEQAIERHSHYCSVAVPSRKGSYDRVGLATDVLHHYGVGLIEVDNYFVREKISAKLHRENNRFAKQSMKKIRPEHKTWAKAGSQSGDVFTPYKRTMREAQNYVWLNPGCTAKEIVDSIDHHYAPTSAKNSLAKALLNFETDWCRAERVDGKLRFYIIEGVLI